MTSAGHTWIDPGSLLRRVETFFVDNPDEWLTFEDIAVKFDCTVYQARGAVERLNLRSKVLQLETIRVVRRAE